MEKNQVVKTGRSKLLISLLTVLIVMVVAVLGVAWYGFNYIMGNLTPVSSDDVEIMVTIPRGASTAKVGSILVENGLIKDAQFFRYYLRYHQLDSKIQAGNYYLSPSLTLDEVVDKLIAGEAVIETVRFTIPEGLFLTDIAQRLADRGLVDKDRFLELANDVERWDYWFLQDLPQGLKYPLEGYLFPDTYEIFMDDDNKEETIIRRMLNRFDQVFTDEMREHTETELGMTVHQVVTLASIVEKETAASHEQPLVAAIFHNRLRYRAETYFMLESCATVNYILGDFSVRPTSAQLAIKDPYNTYVNPYLPPGPIAGPGAGALRAAVYPADVNYKFMVAKDDGSNEHYFGVTYRDHLRNIQLAKKNRR